MFTQEDLQKKFHLEDFYIADLEGQTVAMVENDIFPLSFILENDIFLTYLIARLYLDSKGRIYIIDHIESNSPLLNKRIFSIGYHMRVVLLALRNGLKYDVDMVIDYARERYSFYLLEYINSEKKIEYFYRACAYKTFLGDKRWSLNCRKYGAFLERALKEPILSVQDLTKGVEDWITFTVEVVQEDEMEYLKVFVPEKSLKIAKKKRRYAR